MLLQELVKWWLVRREQYLVFGPVGPEQERTLKVLREVVRVMTTDTKEIRELRWAVLEKVVRGNEEGLRQLVECMAILSAGEQEKELPGYRLEERLFGLPSRRHGEKGRASPDVRFHHPLPAPLAKDGLRFEMLACLGPAVETRSDPRAFAQGLVYHLPLWPAMEALLRTLTGCTVGCTRRCFGGFGTSRSGEAVVGASPGRTERRCGLPSWPRRSVRAGCCPAVGAKQENRGKLRIGALVLLR